MTGHANLLDDADKLVRIMRAAYRESYEGSTELATNLWSQAAAQCALLLQCLKEESADSEAVEVKECET